MTSTPGHEPRASASATATARTPRGSTDGRATDAAPVRSASNGRAASLGRWTLLVTLLVGCRHLERFDPPSLLRRHDMGVCGATIAIDAAGALWRESGCENGAPPLRRVRRLTPSERSAVAEAFKNLPSDRATLTPDEARALESVFAAITRLPDAPCQLPPSYESRPAAGPRRAWSVPACELPGAPPPRDSPPATRGLR